jgi:NADP-dependent 3-hydroxy acid dehydrogenase YdfG
MQQSDLAGQVVIVAGASSGIGRATALAVAHLGARVVLAARNADALAQLVATIDTTGGKALAVPTDTTDHVAAERLIAATLGAYGRVDTLINSVGINIRKRALSELTAESWATMIEVNLTSAFNLTQAVLPTFRRQHGGLLIHITSAAAKKADRSGAAYQASKAGVTALAHATMEEERENGIRSTVIFPGLTDTPLVLQRPVPPTPEMLARALHPEDIAQACLFVMRMPERAYIPELLLYPTRS